jgi:hypothetical protein
MDSKFSEASQILSKFYRCAAVFSAAFLPPKKRQKYFISSSI